MNYGMWALLGSFVLISACGDTQNTQQTSARTGIEGQWQSTDDPHLSLNIDKGLYTAVYSDKVMESNPYQLLDTCPASCGKVVESPCLTVKGTSETCYAILTADAKTLELSEINATSTTNHYQRKP